MNTPTMLMLSWLLTYALHSTVLLGLAKFLSKRATSVAARDVLWKAALVGGIATATLQVGLNIQPRGSMALRGSVATTTLAATSPTDKHEADPAVLRSPAPDAGTPSRSQSNSQSAYSGAPETLTPTGDAGAVPSSKLEIGEVVVFSWAAIAFLLALVYGARRMVLVGRLGDRRLVVEGRLPAILASLRQSAGAGNVTLTSSAAISSPVALNLGEICVPTAALTDLDEDQQRGLLAHELAHLARRDPLWLDVASVIERVLFFQPLNRMARREMQLAAEYLCDDWAAAHIGSGVPLAKCLASVAEWIQASPLGVPVAGMAEQRSMLVERIARLVNGAARPRGVPRVVVVSGAIAVLATMVAAAPGVHAFQPAQPDPVAGASTQASEPSGFDKKTVEKTDTDKNEAEHTESSDQQGGNGDGQEAEQGRGDSLVVIALIERLKDSDAGVRRAAAGALGNLKNRRSVLPLIAVLDDKDREVRMSAVDALSNMKDERAINPLLDLIDDPSADVRQRALDALDDYEREIPAGPVVKALYDKNADVRERAAHLLGAIKDRATVGPLASLMRDPSASVRAAAIQALGEIRDASAANAVTLALKDEDADVRHHAVHALNELKVPVSEKTLLDLLADPSADVRQGVLEIVRERPFPGAIAAIEKLLEDVNGDVRVEAVSALGEIGDPAARRALRAALNSRDAKVRTRAAEVLGERP